MANIYYLPEKFTGKSLNQITGELKSGNPEVLAQYLGVNRETPLTAGQQFSFNTPAGINPSGSGEFQFLNQYFTPYDQYQTQQSEAFSAKQKAEEDAFMSALNEKVAGQETLTNASERIGGELGLPALRDSAFQLTQTLKGIPGVQETISKQVGISAPNLQKRIASEQGKIAPLAQEAVGQQQFAEQELGTRLGYLLQDQQKELEPFYQAALPLLSDRLAREATLYSQDKQNELDILLKKMDQDFSATQAELDRANQLSLLEKEYEFTKNSQSIETIAGRKVLVTYDKSGNLISKVDLGSSTSGSSTGSGLSYLNKKSSAVTTGSSPTSTFQAAPGSFSSGMGLEELQAAGYAQ